ncbi:MAG: sodium-dependent transporter [Bacteroidales bacterium]|jgi:SNF family Na+-dependent transporter|nr:sodium-dependent transporter [Bacteroidales bacterium]
MAKNPEAWGSRIGIVLAMAGNAVGFGNFLRFPAQAIQNGGGAFIIPYIVCFLLLGIPLMFVEWTIGRSGGRYGQHSPPFLFESLTKRALWRYVGVFGIFSTVAIASYYCYLESWTMTYVYHTIAGTFQGSTQGAVSQIFNDYIEGAKIPDGIPYENIIAFILCLCFNVWILSKGLKGGIEKLATWGVPLLILFGVFLAIKGVTIQAGDQGAITSGLEGLNFLWTPQYNSLTDPKVWLAAAGQIFFTLSVGMGCIQCYASYMQQDEDIPLGALSTCFVNEFVEIVLGSTILISISVGFMGLDSVQALVANEGGFGIAFQTMPYLFAKWGPIMGIIAGVAFFGLLFISGITSSVAMCTPARAFLQDEFHISKNKSSLIVGSAIFLWGLPTVLFYSNGVFDQYDYWAGTISLFFFAMMETIFFSWVFGVDKGWKELNRGADIRLPKFLKFVLKFITPALLIVIFVAALIKPKDDNWASLSITGWELDQTSLIGRFTNHDGYNQKWVADTLYLEESGYYQGLFDYYGDQYAQFACINEQMEEYGYVKKYKLSGQDQMLLIEKELVQAGTPIASGKFYNDSLYTSLSLLYLVFLFIIISILVTIAFKKNHYQPPKEENHE